MPKNKSPGPDRFTTEFFISSWSVIGKDFMAAIHSFFKFGFLPKGLNSTILALIPKKSNISGIRDYRPISCCNVVYKVISKLLSNRLKLILPRMIARNQSAFVEGRLLMENVLMATEIVKDYHKDSISKRCTAKIDISKAFDTVQWSFLSNALTAMEIPESFIHLVMLCVSTPSFSVQVNGELCGYFNSTRGLRQGCSLSPYLFVICMNVLSHMIDAACLAGQIGYHPRCKQLRITHLCFADDILVFSDGAPHSIAGIMEVFEDFAVKSGLRLNLEKSTMYLAGFSTAEKTNLLHNFALMEGSLPMKYLGLPLTTKTLTMSDCGLLINKLKTKVNTWTNRFLSFGGRLQLLQSTLAGITNFWLQAFCLPKKCIHEINRICSAFLWSGPELASTKAKVCWSDICCPKNEGGLGIRNLLDTMKVCYLKLIWRIITRQPSLWISWVWEYLIRSNTFWSINENTTKGSWIWRKILKHRTYAKRLYKFKIGDGSLISFWFDNWSDMGCLFDVFGQRGIIDFGFPKNTTLQQAIHQRRSRSTRGSLKCQVEELLSTIDAANVGTTNQDRVLWKGPGTKYLEKFSSKSTWSNIRIHRLTLVWPKFIWISHATPRFAFCSWLAFQDRLTTGDRMKLWNAGVNTSCILCGNYEESRDHLFFTCRFSQQVWRKSIGSLLDAHYTSTWQELKPALLRLQGNKIQFFLACYTLQATIYHIWKERNGRQHGRQSLTARLISKIIDKTVRNNISAIRSIEDTRFAPALNLWFSTRV